ncbi:MAG: hypothetical protein HY043_10370, partial [Verrucomicrobia bacterium]|nr:hypothetical protein [Verrucomicrobiota bacterium]
MQISCRNFGFALLAAGIFTGCGPKKSAGPAAAPVVNVVSIAAKRQSVSESLSLVGTITANESV